MFPFMVALNLPPFPNRLDSIFLIPNRLLIMLPDLVVVRPGSLLGLISVLHVLRLIFRIDPLLRQVRLPVLGGGEGKVVMMRRRKMRKEKIKAMMRIRNLMSLKGMML